MVGSTTLLGGSVSEIRAIVGLDVGRNKFVGTSVGVLRSLGESVEGAVVGIDWTVGLLVGDSNSSSDGGSVSLVGKLVTRLGWLVGVTVVSDGEMVGVSIGHFVG